MQMMTFQGMLGVFILLGISGLLGLVIMIIERIYASAKKNGREKQVRETTSEWCFEIQST